MKNWQTLKKELLKDKKVSKEYKILEPRYILISKFIEARLKRNITQNQLARKIKTKQSDIARFESGKSNPSINFIEKMASALNLKINYQLT